MNRNITLSSLFTLLVTLNACSSLARSTEPAKVACYPPVFVEGGSECKNETAINKAKETIHEILTKVGMQSIDESFVIAAATDLQVSHSNPDLPTPENMLKLGRKLRVQYVVAYRCQWHIKTIIGIGLKTKADCTSSAIIVDVGKGEVVFHPEPLKVGSDKKISSGEIAAALLINPIAAFVSGGPKTPHMQRSAQISLAEILTPWIIQHQPDAGSKITG
jgi:hypothetical protein